jgi:2,3-diaminopropionate biosynthesis protein SbnB
MLGGSFQIAGIKWIASFPGNLSRGLERASATLLLNSIETGILEAVLESSVISAYRTAASAALAANLIRGSQPAPTAGIVGCGLINFETLRFLLKVRPEIRRILVFDASPERARQYRDRCRHYSGGRELHVAGSGGEVLENCDIVSIATTAVVPHIGSLAGCRADGVILHISLRDLEPDAILAADNIVDDVEHVCSNRTSLELTEQQTGNRSFIRATIGGIISGKQQPRESAKTAVFSPFGLGILDLAVGHLACRLARETNAGTAIRDFLPAVWTDR